MRKIVLEIPDGVEITVKGGRFQAWIELETDARDSEARKLDCRSILDKATDHLDFPSRKE